MKVKELIEKLKTFDPEKEVVVDAYQCGYSIATEVYDTQVFKHGTREKTWGDGDYFFLAEKKHPTFIGTNEKVPGQVVDVVHITNSI